MKLFLAAAAAFLAFFYNRDLLFDVDVANPIAKAFAFALFTNANDSYFFNVIYRAIRIPILKVSCPVEPATPANLHEIR